MTVSDMERRDLYTGLEEVLGANRANILMAYLSDPGTLATKSDLNQRFDMVDQRFEAVDRRFERLEDSLLEVNRRLDRLFLAVVTALLAMVVTVWTQIFLG